MYLFNGFVKSLESGKNEKKSRILLVDDDYDIVFTFKKALEEYSQFEVDTFTDPIQALSRFKVNTYDLLVIDIRLPNMDGFELYDKLKEIDNKVKVCFMTAYDINVKALQAVFPLSSDLDGCFIRKPVHIEDFITRIKSELGAT
jgi:DNA-binding response OmpR family regulator